MYSTVAALRRPPDCALRMRMAQYTVLIAVYYSYYYEVIYLDCEVMNHDSGVDES